MLEIFFGTDEKAARAAALEMVARMREKQPGLTVQRLEAEIYETGLLASVSASVSLFGDSSVYIVDTPSVVPEFYDELVAVASTLSTSPVPFLVIEKTLLAAEKKKFAPYATLTEFKKTGAPEFEAFALAEALATRDKRKLWLTLQAARHADQSAEESVGILWWQLKTLQLAALTSSAAEAGVKDYPYNKAKRALTAFKPGELNRLMCSLLELYHDGHAGKRDIDLALEEWVLRG